MQEYEYKQNYKMLVIKWLHKFFININRQFEIITKNVVSRWFTLYKPTQNVIISEETPPHPLCSYKPAR